MDHFLNIVNPWRLKWYPGVCILGVLIGLIISIFGWQGTEILTGRLGGDFPAFYGAGQTIAQGQFDKLYSFDYQKAIQKDLFPSNIHPGVFLPFSYPAFVAFVYYPLSVLPYRISFLVYSLSMMAGLAISALVFRRRFSHLKDYVILLLGIILLYYPMLRSVVGGQNTAITFLFFILVWYFGQLRNEWLAGFFLGLLLFKPQYGIPLIGLHCLAGRWRTAITSLTVGALLYIIAAQFFGFFWIKDWIIYTSWFSKADAVVNAANSVSWLGFFQAILGVKNLAAVSFGLFMTAITITGISIVWVRARHKLDLSLEFALASIAILMIQPHAMYYDMGMVLFAYVLFGCYYRKALKEIILLWILAITQIAAGTLGFSPLFFILLWTGFLGMRIYRESELKNLPTCN